jgi:hypothetical protein
VISQDPDEGKQIKASDWSGRDRSCRSLAAVNGSGWLKHREKCQEQMEKNAVDGS